MRTADLTGQDLAYWVARANTAGSTQECNVLRRHFGHGASKHQLAVEPAMRSFVASKFGETLPEADDWQ